MQYKSEFKSLRGDTINIIITTPAEGEDVELVLSGKEPVVIDYQADDVFKPLKMSGCSVCVLTKEPLLDLYTGTLNQVTLHVYRNNTLIWFGFLTPNVYTSAYKDVYDELTLEFVDPLSAMENVKFKKSEQKWWKSFHELIYDALVSVDPDEYITHIIMSDYVDINLNKTGCMLRNFIDESEEEEDGSMTQREVVQEILKYMGMTCHIMGTSMYIYNPLTTYRCEWVKYTLGDFGSNPVAYNLQPEWYVLGEDVKFAGSNGSIGLSSLYNRITVVENTNPINSLLDTDLIDDDNMEEYMDEEHTYFKARSTYGARLGFYQVPVTVKSSEEGKEDTKWMDLRAVFKTKAPWTLTIDVDHDTIPDDYITPVNDAEGKNRFAVSVPGINYDGFELSSGAFALYSASYEQGFPPSTVDWDKGIMMYINTTKTNAAAYKNRFSIKYQGDEAIVLKGGYIIISLEYEYLERCMTELEKSKIYQNFNIGAEAFVDTWRIRVKVGNKYWNGSEWITTPSSFLMNSTFKTDDKIFGTSRKIDNKATYEMGLKNDAEGWVIPVNAELFGEVTVELCPPSGMCETLRSKAPYPSCAKLKTFSLVYTTAKSIANGVIGVSDDESDTDITICNIIDDNNIVEMDDIELKINTWNASQVSYSYAVNCENGNYSYLQTINGRQPEERIIEKYVQYYSQPRLEYKNTVEDIRTARITPLTTFKIDSFNKEFVVTTISYDLCANSCDITLKQSL